MSPLAAALIAVWMSVNALPAPPATSTTRTLAFCAEASDGARAARRSARTRRGVMAKTPIEGEARLPAGRSACPRALAVGRATRPRADSERDPRRARLFATSVRSRATSRRSHASPRAKLDLKPPRRAIGLEALAAPEERVLGDLAEGPADRRAVRERPYLLDPISTAMTDQLGANAVVRIEPIHSPCL